MDCVFGLYLNKYDHTQCHLGFLLNVIFFFGMLMSSCFSTICFFVIDRLTVCVGFISGLSVLLHDLFVSYQYHTILFFLGLQFWCWEMAVLQLCSSVLYWLFWLLGFFM